MAEPHEILGVEPGADAEGLLRAFRQQAKQHHPDRNPGDPTAAARFRAIVAAYQVLFRAASAKARREVRAFRVSCLASGADLFGTLCLDEVPADARVIVQIDALWPCIVCEGLGEERIAGGWGRVERWECETCRGSGVRRIERRLLVQIPAECMPGGRLRLSGVGLPRPDGPAGDVILVIRLR